MVFIIIPIGLIIRLCMACCDDERERRERERLIRRQRVVQTQPTTVVVTQHSGPSVSGGGLDVVGSIDYIVTLVISDIGDQCKIFMTAISSVYLFL